MPAARALTLGLALLMLACDPTPATEDAGEHEDARDAGADAGVDAGPLATGCELLGQDAGAAADAGALPEPSAFPRATGPGGPSAAFASDALFEACAYLPLGETDENHHNTGFFLDGYLVRPWAHERGRGGVAVFEFDDACAPVLVSNALDEQIRETHATGLSTMAGRHIAVASLTGVQIWDMADVTSPQLLTDLALDGVTYPDSYQRVVMSVFWQAPYLYVGASDNGVYIVDAADPSAPSVLAQYDPGFRVGQLHVVGTRLYLYSSQGSAATTVDISDPAEPRAIPGAEWAITDGDSERFGRPIAHPSYFGHLSGGFAYHARIGLSRGLSIYDVRDPGAPEFVGNFTASGDGGYVYVKSGLAFVGLSDFGVMLDVTDPSAPVERGRFELEGDLDTVTPFGNVAIVSVDDDAVPGQASAVMPFAEGVDTQAPVVNMVVPEDGATAVALSARLGVTFDEFVAMESVWRASVIVAEVASGAVIEGHLSGQEGVVNFWPARPLAPATEYELRIPAGGVTDLNGNATDADFRSRFTTVSCD